MAHDAKKDYEHEYRILLAERDITLNKHMDVESDLTRRLARVTVERDALKRQARKLTEENEKLWERLPEKVDL
jgi:fibronectin type 3 domain-containing protein